MKFCGRLVVATNFYDFEKAKAWLLSLNLKGRKPRGVDQKNWNFINHAKGLLKWGDSEATAPQVLRAVNDLTPEMIAVLEGKMGAGAPSSTIKVGDITFIKEDASAYTRFEEATKEIASFLRTLKGYHKAPARNLTIKFVGKSQAKAKAKYIRREDTIWMRFYKGMPKEGEAYGSVRYVLLHELGHRYLKHHPQGWDINAGEWTTTKYSRVDSMTEEERFAELFALSHWPNKYHQYSDTIKKFQVKIR